MLNISIFLFTVHYQEVHTLKFPDKLRILKNGLINIKNNDNRCFFWCDVRHSNLLKINPERIIKKKQIEKLLMTLIMKILNFLSLEKILVELKRKIIFALMNFIIKIILFMYQIKNLKIS